MFDPFSVICLMLLLACKSFFFFPPLNFHMFAAGILAGKRREGQHKGFSKHTNGGPDCSTTATGHALALTRIHLHTSPIRPDDCLGARWHSTSLSLSHPFFPLCAQPVPKTKTQFAVYFFLFNHTHTRQPAARLRLDSSVLASRLDGAPAVCCTHVPGATTNRFNLTLTLATSL